MRRHINATTAKARNKGLEGAAPGTSASLIYTDHKGRKIEGRQDYPVRVYADGAYVGVLNPGETMDTFAASRIDEMPVYKKGGKIKGSDGKACWKGYRFVGTKNGKDRCIKVKEDGSIVEQPDSGPEIIDPIDYTQYEHIPSSHFEVPTGEFQYTTRVYTGDDEDGKPIFETQERTGVHNPDWYSPDFDPFEYYSSGEYEGMEYRNTPVADYENNPYMENEEMRHPLVWNEDRLKEENRKRFNQSVINDIYNEDGTLKPEWESKLGEKRYLRPFGPNFEDAPNNIQKEGRWSSDWFEGSSSGWGKPGNDDSWRYNKEAGTFNTYVPGEFSDGRDGRFKDLTEKELKKLYKKYKKYPGFGDISKSEFIDRYKSGDIFHPQIAGVDQEKAWIQTFEDKVQPFKQGEFDAQKDFFDGAISSDLYREKLIAQGYENVDDIVAQREEALGNATLQYESTAQHYSDENVDTGGGDKSGYRKGLEGEYDMHTNDIYSILDKRKIIYDLIDEGKINTDNLGKWEAEKILSMYNNYTPFGDEAPPTEHGFFNDGERDALFWSKWKGRGINMSDFLNRKINEGKTGSRAYVTSPDGKTVISPRQLQQLNIDLGGEGTTKELHSFLDEVSAHELGHQMGAVNTSEKVPYGLNKNDQNTIHRLMEESGVNLDDLNWHDRAAYERKADLDALRWKMYNTIGYDYRTTPMTNEILQEYKNYIKENPIPSLVNDRNFEFFKDDKLIEFNNTVADATDEIGGDDLPPTTQVRYGGPAKYQNAGNVIKDAASKKWNTIKDQITSLPENIKTEWNKLKNQSFPIPEIGLSAIDDKLKGHVITPMQEIRNAKTGEVNKELTEFLDKNYSNLLEIYNNSYDWKDQSWYEKIGSITGSLSSLYQIAKENRKSGTFDFYQDGSDVQIQEPNLDIQADSTAIENPPVESIFSQEELDYVDFIQNRKPYRDGTTIGNDPEMFYLDLYNTDLTADELLEYYVWKDTLAQRRSLLNNTSIEQELARLDMDLGAYDVQGFWKSGDYKNTDSDGHGSDKWKKPNHPTFSNQSKYASNYELPDDEEDNRSEYEGGIWNSDGGYVPSMHNMYSNKRLHSEFNREPHRNEFLYLGNDLIYQQNLVPSNLIPTIGPANLENIDLNFQKEIPYKYQDASEVKMQNPNLFISEPNTVEMDEKFTKMYRDQDEELLNKLTFDGSTEEGMIDFLKFTENGIAKGYRKNDKGEMRWFPHKDSKGIWTIGYGHNMESAGETLEQYKNGLTDTEVEELLKSDMKVHTDLLEKNVPEWENLSTLQKNALLDIQYNIRGNVWTKFPSFTKAVVNKDWQNVVIHGSRAEYGNKPNQRNTAFYKSIIEPMVEEWRPEIRNPDASFLNPEFIEINKHVAKRDNTMVGQNSFGGWEEGSEVTHPEIGPEVDVSWNPSAVDMTPFLQSRVNDYQNKFPNYSDQDVYKFYLENTTPDQQNVMLPTIQNRGNSTMVTPVPFYSTHFSTSMETPNLYKPTGEQCVAYGRLETGCAGGLQLAMEFNTDLSRNGVRNVNGIQGSAWEMHSNVLAAGGQSLFNYSDDMDTEYMRSNPNEIDADYLLSRYNNARSNRGNQAQLNEGLLQVGDMVDLFYAHSSYQADALVNGKGSNVNSHVGVITEGPNGKLYVTHNVKGTWFSDDLESMLNTQRMKNGKGHRVMIVGGYRPQYETGLVDGISIHPDKRSEVDAKAGMYTGWDGAVATDYLNNLGLVMPDIQTDFNLSDSDATLIAEASYGTFGAESTFAEGGRYEHKSWAREFLRGYKDADNEPETFWDNFKMPNLAFRLLGKDITEGKLDMDDLSEGMTQIKHRAFMEDEYVSQLFLNYGISDPDSLYTPAGASRGTALVHTMNLDLINNLFKDHNLSPQTKKNMLFKAYNAGFDNVLKSFIDEEKGIITPTSFENGRKIYAERHLDKKSMTYLPNQLNKLISFDYSKLKQGKREIDNYSIETMSGFETMFFDMNNKLDELSTKVSDKVDVKVTKGEQKLHRGIKKVERFLDKGYKTKKVKFLKKADDLMNKLYETSNSSVDKIKDKSEKINTQLKNENKKIKNTVDKIKNKVSSIF